MLERNAAVGEVLSEAAPGCEIELVGFLELRQVSFESWSLGEQTENTPLIEHADVILPHHVIDGRQLCAVANQHGCQTGEPVSHTTTCGIGIATANPAR